VNVELQSGPKEKHSKEIVSTEGIMSAWISKRQLTAGLRQTSRFTKNRRIAKVFPRSLKEALDNWEQKKKHPFTRSKVNVIIQYGSFTNL